MTSRRTYLFKYKQAKFAAFVQLAAFAFLPIACGEQEADSVETSTDIGQVQQSIEYNNSTKFTALTLYEEPGFVGKRKEIPYRYSNLAHGEHNLNTEAHKIGSYRSFVLARGCEATFCEDGEHCRVTPGDFDDGYYNSNPSHLKNKNKVWITCWDIGGSAPMGRNCTASGQEGDCLPLYNEVMEMPVNYSEKNESMDINGNDYPGITAAVTTGGSHAERVWFVQQGVRNIEFGGLADEVTEFLFYRNRDVLDCWPSNTCFSDDRCEGFEVETDGVTIGDCSRAVGPGNPGSWCNAQHKCFKLTGEPEPVQPPIRIGGPIGGPR